MIDIKEMMRSVPGIDDYRVVTKNTRSYETFFVHRKLETVRATNTTDTQVTVYVRHDGKMGDSSFALYESTDIDAAITSASKAVARAGLVYNEAYDLPENDTDEAEIPSGFSKLSMPEAAALIAEAVFKADTYEKGSLNATEIFVYEDTVSVYNSRGIKKTQHKYRAAVETIPTWNDSEESVELYEYFEFTEPDGDMITAEIDKRMREVRDRRTAVKPQPMTCRVVIGPHEITELVGCMSDQLDYSAVYSHANLYKTGDDIQSGSTGDKITLTKLARLPGSVRSASFDGDGTRLTDRNIISDGKAVSYFGANRFARYLGEEPTGDLGCTRLEPGTLTVEELENGPYLECVSLSGLQVDMYNDYIGGEIRLAYYHNGSYVEPVTGISMSGKLSAALGGLRLSSDTVIERNYSGPAALMIPEMYVL